uniref:BPTI/Kunitz inhibitor domain-containing protein n=1 Tax=Anisakis simplex TaxID=6269 RepID=A0A0M3KDN8_ANISI
LASTEEQTIETSEPEKYVYSTESSTEQTEAITESAENVSVDNSDTDDKDGDDKNVASTEQQAIENGDLQQSSSEGPIESDDSVPEDVPYGRMMLKPANKEQLNMDKGYYQPANSVKSTSDELNDGGVEIDIGDTQDPFDSDKSDSASPFDRSNCQLKPTEGRPCREDEVSPRTNLQFFYSRRDNKCKLYFYRGCGGNANRFETKRLCESACMVSTANIYRVIQ